MGWLVSLCF